jgi:hypothetical protein
MATVGISIMAFAYLGCGVLGRFCRSRGVTEPDRMRKPRLNLGHLAEARAATSCWRARE